MAVEFISRIPSPPALTGRSLISRRMSREGMNMGNSRPPATEPPKSSAPVTSLKVRRFHWAAVRIGRELKFHYRNHSGNNVEGANG